MYCGFYSSCGELDKFETLFLFRLGKKLLVPFQGSMRTADVLETVWNCYNLLCAQTSYRKAFEICSGNRTADFQVWSTQEGWKFRTCAVKKYLFVKHGLMVVDSSRASCGTTDLKRAERESKNKIFSTVNSCILLLSSAWFVGLFSV